MSRGLSNELKVGAFTIGALGLLLFGYVFTYDGVSDAEGAYTVHLLAPSADGVWEGTPVKLAGVDIGGIESIEVDGNQARILLSVESHYQLPTDSVAEMRSSGMLGERYIAIDPGRAETSIPDGGRIAFGEEPGDLDAITREVELISQDVKAITGVLREVVEDDANREHLEATIANVDALSYELRTMAEQNRQDIGAIVDSVRRLSESLEAFTTETSEDVDVEMSKLHEATDALDTALDDLTSITGKIDRGEGTLGALVNDRETIDALNETIDNANAVIESVSGLHAEVYYLGRLYGGTQPQDPAFFYGNPLAPNLDGGWGYAGSNTLGLFLNPQEDFGWIFEVNDYPQGSITAEQRFYPDLGTSYTEWTRKIDYRFTFQMQKRWWDLGFRLGVKENGGGVGVTWYGFNDRVSLSGDAFDFAFGSYPALEASGTPNVRVALRAEPIERIWVEAGTEQLLLSARYGYFTGFVGAGFHFTDDDIKMLLATLPIGL